MPCSGMHSQAFKVKLREKVGKKGEKIIFSSSTDPPHLIYRMAGIDETSGKCMGIKSSIC